MGKHQTRKVRAGDSEGPRKKTSMLIHICKPKAIAARALVRRFRKSNHGATAVE